MSDSSSVPNKKRDWIRIAKRIIVISMPLMMVVGTIGLTDRVVAADNLKVYVHIIRIVCRDGANDNNAAIEPFSKIKCVAGTYSNTVTSPKFYDNQRYGNPNYIAVFDVPNTATQATITIGIYDKDLMFDDHLDISGGGVSDLTVTYYKSTSSWSGSTEYKGDANGYGFTSGTEDSGGSDADVHFYIAHGLQSSVSVSGYVRDNSGSPISGATVKLFAWTYKPQLPEWFDYKSTPNDPWGQMYNLPVIYGTTTTSTSGYYYFSWTKGMTCLMLSAGKQGYWTEKSNITIPTNGLGTVNFQIPANTTGWATCIPVFCKLLPNMNVKSYLYYSTTHSWSSSVGVYGNVGWQTTTLTRTYSSSVTVGGGAWNSTSCIRSLKVWTTGTFWADGGGRPEAAWSTGPTRNPGEFNDLVDVVDYKSFNPASPPAGAWPETTTGSSNGNYKTVYRSDSGSMSLESTLRMGVGVPILGGLFPVKIGVSLSDTDSTSATVGIDLYNYDVGKQHTWWFWLENGLVLHCWQTS